MADGEWRVGPVGRQREDREGAEIDYPGRVAMCPRGHVRVLPSRFSRTEFELRCQDCKRSYMLRVPQD